MRMLLSRVAFAVIFAIVMALSAHGISMGQDEAQASGVKLQIKQTITGQTKVKDGPNGCYEVWKNTDGTLDVRINCLVKGDYQASARKFELCRLAWLEDFEKNFKTEFFFKKESVLGFRKDDPAEYRERPLIRLLPRKAEDLKQKP